LPLSGIRVLDFSRAVSGPLAGRILADLGADVVKVEPADGDVSDRFGQVQGGRAALFAQMNAGKRNIGLDLRAAADTSLAKDLAAVADVVIENFRTGVMERLGLGFEAISATNPRVVMLSISGFGAESPESARRAYAPVIHAESGALVRQSRAHDVPLVDQSHSIADTFSALHGTIAVLAALRRRDQSGRGAHVDLGMLQAVVASDDHAHEAIEGLSTVGEHWGHIYEGVGGPIMLAMSAPGIWRTLSRYGGLTDGLQSDVPLATKAAVRFATVNEWLASFDQRADMTAALDAAGIGWAEVRAPEDLLDQPTFQASPPFDDVADGAGGSRRVVRMPYRFDGEQFRVAGRVAPADADRAPIVADWLDPQP
jgi:crotonobetainyl-CoA:carnitine CoA-transferase CaiB-like acyl-CoA transferase